MTQIRKSDHGIVVEHLESGVRYAVSDRNYNVKVHRKVRELGPGESVLTYAPRRKGSLGAENSPTPTPTPAGEQGTDPSDNQ